MKTLNEDPLGSLKVQVEAAIYEKYRTAEEFCWDKDLNKATISNFINGKKDFQVSTLVKIANALGKKLKINLE